MKRISLGNTVSEEGIVGDFSFIPNRAGINEKILVERQLTVFSNSSTNNDTTISPGGRSNKEQPLNMIPGNQYTFIVFVKMEDKLNGVLNSQSLSINYVPAIDFEFQWHYSQPVRTVNERGDWPVVLHINVPMNSTGGMIRLNAGMFKDRGEVTWHDAWLFNGNLPLEKLVSFEFGELIKPTDKSLSLDPDLIARYRLDLDPFIEVFRNTELSPWADLIESIEPLYDTRESIKVLKNLAQKKNVTEMRQFVIGADEKNMPMFGVDRKKFAEPQISFAVERMALLKFLSTNIDKIREMTKSTEKISDMDKFPIFVFWAQGFEQAPAIVKSNLNHLQKEISNFEVHLLTMDNIEHYIDIPWVINTLLPEHTAHFSDFARIALLEKYGGIWLDATVLVGKDFEIKIKEIMKPNSSDILTPRYGDLKTSSGISNWFIAASSPNNYGVMLVKSALVLWMLGHKKFRYYYHFHAFFDLLILLDSKFGDIWYQSPYVSAERSHYLQRNMFENMPVTAIKSVLEQEVVQKLTYKYNNRESNRFTADSTISKIIRMQ